MQVTTHLLLVIVFGLLVNLVNADILAHSVSASQTRTASHTPPVTNTPTGSLTPTISYNFNPNLWSTKCGDPCSPAFPCNPCLTQDCSECHPNGFGGTGTANCINPNGGLIPSQSPFDIPCGNRCGAPCFTVSDCAYGFNNTCSYCWVNSNNPGSCHHDPPPPSPPPPGRRRFTREVDSDLTTHLVQKERWSKKLLRASTWGTIERGPLFAFNRILKACHDIGIFVPATEIEFECRESILTGPHNLTAVACAMNWYQRAWHQCSPALSWTQ